MIESTVDRNISRRKYFKNCGSVQYAPTWTEKLKNYYLCCSYTAANFKLPRFSYGYTCQEPITCAVEPRYLRGAWTSLY